MGFRSTLCSQHYPGVLPEWFKEKYNEIVLFPSGLLVVSKIEAKYYDNEFFNDYKKALFEAGFWNENEDRIISLSVLAEDGVITKVNIYKNEILYFLVGDFEYDVIKTVWQG